MVGDKDWQRIFFIPFFCSLLLVPMQVMAAEKAAIGEEHIFPDRTIPFYASDKPGSKAIGKVMVATRITELQSKGNMKKVRIEGWYQDGAKRVLYAVPGKRILDLALKKKATDHLVDLESLKDEDTGITWNKAEIVGWIRNKNLSGDIAKIWQAADDIFSVKCTACHVRRTPHHYTANQWTGNLKAMAPRAALSKEQRTLVLKFLQYRAKDMVSH